MNRTLALFALVAFASGCHHNAGTDPQAIVGSYGEYHGHIAYLDLHVDGGYECFVMNGMVDGCLTVEGAGISSGTWELSGDVVSFTPQHEPPGLVVSLQGATAIASSRGLLLSASKWEQFLPRNTLQSAQADKPIRTDRPSADR